MRLLATSNGILAMLANDPARKPRKRREATEGFYKK